MGQSIGKSIIRRSPSSCPGPNNLPPLQFHPVHGDNIRLSRDGTLARRFESFCRAITFSARPVRINERICIKFAEISNNWNGGIRFGFTTNDPATLENALPKYACPDLTNRPGFWAKALHEQYCEKDNILYYYVNTAGDVIYGINNEEKGVILSGIDTRGLLWTIIDIYGNCTAIEFLDARIYMYQQSGLLMSSSAMHNGLSQTQQQQAQQSQQQQHLARRVLPSVTASTQQVSTAMVAEQELLNSMQSLHLTAVDQTALASDLANGLPPLRYNAQGRLIPVPFHITKGRNVRLSHDRFIASRTESDFCQGYVFTARPIRIGEKLIVQVLKTEQMYVGALALGLTSCNPSTLQANDLPNDSDFLLDRPEYWVVSKDIASAPQRCDEIAFFVAPNGEVTISKNNGAAVTVMHVDQSLQLWAFLDVYGSTQSVRMFRQQLPNMIAYPQLSAASSSRVVNIPVSESLNSLNNQMSEARKLMHPSQLNVTHSTISSSSSTLAAAGGGRMISVPSNGDILQIQPNGGGTVLVVNLPPASSPLSNNELNQARVASTNGGLNAACSSATIVSNGSNQYIEPISCSTNGGNVASTNGHATPPQQQTTQQQQQQQKRKDVVDHHSAVVGDNANVNTNSSSAECTICYENPIDSVLYMCGHMCMCYDCAIEQWRGVGFGQCPLCRAVIRDVIRTYTT